MLVLAGGESEEFCRDEFPYSVFPDEGYESLDGLDTKGSSPFTKRERGSGILNGGVGGVLGRCRKICGQRLRTGRPSPGGVAGREIFDVCSDADNRNLRGVMNFALTASSRINTPFCRHTSR